MSFRHALPILGTLTVLVLSDLPASAGAERFGFVTIGDMPYTLPRDVAAFERLIRRINEIKPLFTVCRQTSKSAGFEICPRIWRDCCCLMPWRPVTPGGGSP